MTITVSYRIMIYNPYIQYEKFHKIWYRVRYCPSFCTVQVHFELMKTTVFIILFLFDTVIQDLYEYPTINHRSVFCTCDYFL